MAAGRELADECAEPRLESRSLGGRVANEHRLVRALEEDVRDLDSIRAGRQARERVHEPLGRVGLFAQGHEVDPRVDAIGLVVDDQGTLALGAVSVDHPLDEDPAVAVEIEWEGERQLAADPARPTHARAERGAEEARDQTRELLGLALARLGAVRPQPRGDLLEARSRRPARVDALQQLVSDRSAGESVEGAGAVRRVRERRRLRVALGGEAEPALEVEAVGAATVAL